MEVIFENKPDPNRILEALGLCWKAQAERETGRKWTAEARFDKKDENEGRAAG